MPVRYQDQLPKEIDLRFTSKLYGGFPGGQRLGSEEARRAGDTILSKSPFRYYGLAPRRECIQLENNLANLCRVRNCQVVSSGTAALHCALKAIDIRPGDEVIIPAYGWISDLMVVIACGAIPVIAPIDETLNFDPERIGLALSEKTKGIICIHMRGDPCDIKKIKRVAPGIPLIEDCAQAFGATIAGRAVGGFGDIGTFSFQFNKLITGGEGGALVTSDEKYFNYARSFQDNGLDRNPEKGEPTGLKAISIAGLNYHMSELTASVINSQFDKHRNILEGLRNNYIHAENELNNYLPDAMPRGVSAHSERNHAFLVRIMQNPTIAEETVASLNRLGVPAVSCGTKDPHHFRVWEKFMIDNNIKYRVIAGEDSSRILDRSFYVEINSQVLGI